MKKLLILSAAALFFVAGVNAQGNGYPVAKAKMDIKDAKAEKKDAKKQLHALEGSEVGVMAQDHFYEDFGNVDAVWKRTKYFDEASFIKDGKATVAYYDAKAELVGTTNAAVYSDIPESAQKAILKQYKGYTAGKVTLFNDNESNPSDMVLYGSAVSDTDNYYVELTKGAKTIIVQVNMEGGVSYFTEAGR